MIICDNCNNRNRTCYVRLADGVGCVAYSPKNLPKADADSLSNEVVEIINKAYSDLHERCKKKGKDLRVCDTNILYYMRQLKDIVSTILT